MKQYVVTISRQFGSMGRMIAQQLSRELYHRRYCPEYVDASTNKDIMLDSSRFGVEGCAKILVALAKDMFA